MNQRTRISTFAAIALLGCCGLAIAQDRPAERGQQARPERAERPALEGPRVREQRVPGQDGGFIAGDNVVAMARQIVPPEVFRRAIGSIMAEDAPLEIRLSPEQRERIAGHVRAFEREFGGQGPAQARGQGTARERGQQPGRPQEAPGRQRIAPDRPSGSPDADRPGPRPERPAPQGGQRNQGQPAGGPMVAAVADLQKRVWSELSAAQQAHVAKAIESWRTQADNQQMDRMRERFRGEIGARMGEMDGRGRDDAAPERPNRRPTAQGERGPQQAAGPGELRRWFSQLPEDVRDRVRARLEAMPPERREALVARAIEMTDEQRAQMVRRLLQSEPGRGEAGRVR